MNIEGDAGRRRISIAEFVELAAGKLPLEPLCSRDVLEMHELDSARVQKLGLLLSGFAEKVHRGRIQIFGNSERSYLARLGPAEVVAAYSRLDRTEISCILVTLGIEPPEELLRFAADNSVPLLSTTTPSSETISAVSDILSVALAPSASVHGVFMEVFGIGVLLTGESGIGKSECALDLIGRGHRLVADDSVSLKRVGDKLYGEAAPGIRDYLEIRGLGIINARELFGVSVLADSAEVRFCIEFSSAANDGQDRLGLDAAEFTIHGVNTPLYMLPVRPGRNLATLVEAAVRVFVSRQSGPDAVHELIRRHDATLTSAGDH